MDPDFWHERWSSNRIAFHEGEANKMLVTHFGKLGLSPGARVFVPLCGKTRDIAWLREQNMQVAGAELSELAVQALFEEMGIKPVVRTAGALKHYSAVGLDIFAGDIFDLHKAVLGPIDLVFDRAALVALPEVMRPRYTRQVTGVTDAAQQLLITFDYDQAVMDGPPFAVTGADVRSYYGETYEIEHLEGRDVEGGLKGIADAVENVWCLKP